MLSLALYLSPPLALAMGGGEVTLITLVAVGFGSVVMLLSKSDLSTGLLGGMASPAQQEANKTKVLLSQAQQALQLKQWDAALTHLQAASEHAPTNPTVWLKLGQVLRRLGQWPKALEALSKAIELAPHNPVVQYRASAELAQGYQEAKDWPNAIQAWQTVLQWQPNHTDAYEKLATCYHESGNAQKGDEALAAAEHSYRHAPSRQFELQAKRAERLLQTDDVQQALPILKKLADTDTKKSLPYKKKLGELMLQQHQWEKGIGYLKQWLRHMQEMPHLPSYGEYDHVAYEIASAMVQLVRNEQATTEARLASTDPPSDLVRTEQAQAHYALLNEALALAPTNPDVLAAMAHWHQQQKQQGKALLFLQEQLRQDPDNAVLLASVAQGLQAEAGFASALPYWHRLLELEPSHAVAAYQLGVGYGQQNQLQQAHHYLVKALQNDPTHAKAAYNLGVTYERLGQPTEALALFERACLLDPTLEAAQANYLRLSHTASAGW